MAGFATTALGALVVMAGVAVRRDLCQRLGGQCGRVAVCKGHHGRFSGKSFSIWIDISDNYSQQNIWLRPIFLVFSNKFL